MKDIQHKIIAIYRRGLLVVTGHAPEGNLLLIRYMSTSAYIPITAPIINDPLLKYTKIFFFIKSNPFQITFFSQGSDPTVSLYFHNNWYNNWLSSYFGIDEFS